jgi:uncharacterized protein YecT (DUF1311 family)
MNIFSRYSVAVGVSILAAATACNGSKKEAQPTATAPEDTMLLHDLAEANKNTANAAAQDNSLTALKAGGDSQAATPTMTVSGTTATPQTQIVSRPTSPSSDVVRPSGVETREIATATRARPASRSEDSNRTTPRSTTSHAVSSGDPCDSPAAADQRTCLNRYIVANDADLNQTYQDLIAQSRKSGGPELEERLREAQRAWVNDRDMACRRSGDDANGLWARPVARCLADYSAKRTAELRHTLSSLRGQ